MTVKQQHFIALFAFFLTTFGAANATPIDVKYEIETYSSGGFSASWLHTASGCTGTGPDSDDTLYMCGGLTTPVTGYIKGSLDGDILSIVGGTLFMLGKDYDIKGGSLGGDFTNAVDDLLWYLDVEFFGTFYFENIAMGPGGPNSFDGQEFILWGQNDDAYHCVPDPSKGSYCNSWGIDLYAQRVPEPGTLALISLGLFAFALTSLRRRVAARRLL